MRQILSLLITLTLLAGLVSVTATVKASIPFTDVPSAAWYCDEVEAAYDAGIMKGKTDTTFDPTANMTRAEFVTVLCRLSGEDCDGFGVLLTFTDTKTDAWYSDAVAWGASNGLVKGLPENKFAPSAPVTRQEMAVFVDRLVTYMELTPEDSPKVDSFKDTAKVANFAKSSVELMRKSGIITGDANGYFNPTDNASRAEVATVVTRLLPVVKDENEGGAYGDAVIDRENFDVQKAFLYVDANDYTLPYRIYIPEDYSAEREYPLLMYLGDGGYGTDNVSQLYQAQILFATDDSPAFDSIVVVPQTEINFQPYHLSPLGEVLDEVTSRYTIDSERVYIIGCGDGAWPLWKMMLKFPTKMSAALFVHGVGPTVYGLPDGTVDAIIDTVPAEALDIAVHFIHDIDDGVKFEWSMGPDYGEKMLYALTEIGGFTNVSLTETSGYGADIIHHFITEDNDSALDWLYTQRRETN